MSSSSNLSLLQVEVAGLDARMVALAQQQAQLQTALGRKQSLSEQLTEVRTCTGTLALTVFCYCSRHFVFDCALLGSKHILL